MASQQLAIAVAPSCRLTMQKLLTPAVAATKLLSHPGELTHVRATFAGRPATLCLLRLTPLLTCGIQGTIMRATAGLTMRVLIGFTMVKLLRKLQRLLKNFQQP